MSTRAHLRLALAQVNPKVGDLAGNAALVVAYTVQAADQGSDLVVFPEMMLTGYPIEDLALRPSFQSAVLEQLHTLADDIKHAGCAHLPVIVGYLDQQSLKSEKLGVPAGNPQNALALIHEGAVVATYAKHHLPNYGVFDEFRYFIPGEKSLVFRHKGIDIGVAICEDLWQEGGPVAQVKERNAGLLVVINGSPYEQDKDDARFALCSRRAREAGCTLAYVNMTGGQDELVFDGDSMIVDSAGNLVARAPQFEDGLMVTDLELPVRSAGAVDHVINDETRILEKPLPAGIAMRLDMHGELWSALVVGLRDYVEKNNFKSVILGLSGGIDSALVAAIAVDALGADRVFGVSLPSKYSSDHSKSDAYALAANMGINIRTVEIEPLVAAFVDELKLTGLAEENVQARVRGTSLMALSNSEGHLVLATGNKSELAVGYSTIYGDAVGGFAPIKDVPKTMVWELAKWRNVVALAAGEVAPIPESSISKEPSAELRPDQRDSDSLPEYPILDRILDAYVQGDLGAEWIAREGFDPTLIEKILRMVDGAEYKRRQYPPGTKVSVRAFGRDRRLPITSAWREIVTRP
ncbi:MAG: NAD+ synthase [Actinobacteria bacterium]|uniref:NAD(+) synthase (glutamine-hydrolyzing) n=1 Tax=freshwater metagenome TaxID=449393 RepID=A0A6J6PU59_9ZZZZ|nr:NAD+ synthase [Actinomycetota bacterium]